MYNASRLSLFAIALNSSCKNLEANKRSFMSVSKKPSRPFSWFWMEIAVVFLISVCLRFWGLSRFNTLVFDEVYYAKFANDYLTHTQFFNAHPPLGQYIIAIGLWIGSYLPFGQDTVNNLTGSLHSTWSYRWLNALTGSFIPLVVAGIAYQLSHRRSYTLLATIFAAADGLFLVESRYALNNVYLVIFGLIGQWLFLLALNRYGSQRRFWLTLAGISFGASAAVKWNGLWFLLGAYLIWTTAWVIQWVRSHRGKGGQGDKEIGVTLISSFELRSPLENLTQLNWLSILFYLGIIPVLVYSISWIPHLQINPTPGFWAIQKKILEYHQHLGNGPNVHPYCSAWYTWPLMLRPMAYFYKTAQSLGEPVPIVGPPLPAASAKVIYDVHAMGNPILWWLSTAAIVFLFWTLARRQGSGVRGQGSEERENFERSNTWISLYLILNWLANLLPWVKVTRCTFIYHYMGASVFAGLALAWVVDRWLQSYRRDYRAIGVTAIFLVLLAFVFWMPVYLGLPLSPESFRLRMWFPSWI